MKYLTEGIKRRERHLNVLFVTKSFQQNKTSKSTLNQLTQLNVTCARNVAKASRPKTLRAHYKTVHEGHRYKCDHKDCNETLLQKYQLKVHLLEHDGKFQFICKLCSKGYNHKGNLESH